MDISINFAAVVVAAISAMVVGALWYGPFFSKHWMKEMGMDKLSPSEIESMKKAAGKNYLQQFLGAVVMAYVLAHIIQLSSSVYGFGGVQTGLTTAFWLWLGFIVPVKYGDKLWGGKSAKLFFIDSFHYLVSLGVMGIILVSWK